MSNVIDGPFITRLNIPVERVVRKAGEADLHEVLILGHDKQGHFYFAANFGDAGNALYLMEKARLALLGQDVPDEIPF